MHRFNIAVAGAIAVTLVFLHHYANAQVQQTPDMYSLTQRAGTTNYRFAEPNELTISVSIIGEIKLPGRYEISRTINLVDLVALAGGWGPEADPSDVTITRTSMVGGRTDRRNIQVDMSNPTKLTDAIVQLAQGDLIVVGKSSWTEVGRVFQIVTVTAVLVTTYFSIANYSRR